MESTHLFLGLFLAGLVLAVGAMLFGVERKRQSATGAPTIGARLTVPNVAAFATVSGAVGYLLHRYSSLGTAAVFVIATTAGALGVVGAVLLVARWALPAVAGEVVDERYVLQGHPARVTRIIADAAGAPSAYEISYEEGGATHVLRAHSLEGTALAPGSEVVIERVENGAAYVEAWSVVERRL
ncbi:MAG TPA: hypothetical protein VFN39_10350 [Gemmatimonadaceae bacterium]|nr:hypothetical protein [Gemmatimonadaceae bacterium]